MKLGSYTARGASLADFATELVDRIAEVLRLRGVKRLEVTANPHALEFYRAVGFTDCGTARTAFGMATRMARPIES